MWYEGIEMAKTAYVLDKAMEDGDIGRVLELAELLSEQVKDEVGSQAEAGGWYEEYDRATENPLDNEYPPRPAGARGMRPSSPSTGNGRTSWAFSNSNTASISTVRTGTPSRSRPSSTTSSRRSGTAWRSRYPRRVRDHPRPHAHGAVSRAKALSADYILAHDARNPPCRPSTTFGTGICRNILDGLGRRINRR